MCLTYPTDSMTYYKIFTHKDNKLWPAFRNCLLLKKPRKMITELHLSIDEYVPFERTENVGIQGNFHAFVNLKDARETLLGKWNFTNEEKVILRVHGTVEKLGLFDNNEGLKPAVIISNMYIPGYSIENIDYPIEKHDLTTPKT